MPCQRENSEFKNFEAPNSEEKKSECCQDSNSNTVSDSEDPSIESSVTAR